MKNNIIRKILIKNFVDRRSVEGCGECWTRSHIRGQRWWLDAGWRCSLGV